MTLRISTANLRESLSHYLIQLGSYSSRLSAIPGSVEFGSFRSFLLTLTALGLVALYFAPSHISDLHRVVEYTHYILHILLPCATYFTCTPLTSVTRVF